MSAEDPKDHFHLMYRVAGLLAEVEKIPINPMSKLGLAITEVHDRLEINMSRAVPEKEKWIREETGLRELHGQPWWDGPPRYEEDDE